MSTYASILAGVPTHSVLFCFLIKDLLSQEHPIYIVISDLGRTLDKVYKLFKEIRQVLNMAKQ